VTSSGQFVPEIDGLRFVAIMAVVLFHLESYLFSPAPAEGSAGELARIITHTGWFGVQLFFVISGFILSMPFAQHRLCGGREPKLGKYFLRRVTRLEPPYIINLLLMYVLALTLEGFSQAPDHSAWGLLPHLGASLTYTHNLAYGQFSLINNVAWSLEIEVQFYILAPLLACVFMIRNRWLRRAAIVAAIAVSSWKNCYYWTPLVELTLVKQIKYFLLGFLLADVYLTEWKSRPGRSVWWDLIGLASWAAIPWLVMYNDEKADFRTYYLWLDQIPLLSRAQRHEFVLPAVMLLAYMSAFRGRVLNGLFRFRWVTVIGGMCYTIYLYHNTIITLFNRWFWWDYPDLWWLPQGVLRTAVLLAVVLVASSVAFVLVERPCMERDWPRRLWNWLRRRLGLSQPTEPASVSDASGSGAPAVAKPVGPREPAGRT
jgi:peptidoglycan/LPS O-acetylase OafA/YrhL